MASDIRRAVGLAAVIGCCLCVAACGSSGGSGGGGSGSGGSGGKGPVVISLVSAKIPGLDFLDPYDSGAQAAAKLINSQGGFGGRKLEIDPCNSMFSPAVATTCAHQALEQHPTAMVGCEPAWGASGLTILGAEGIPSFNCLNGGVDFTSPYSVNVLAGGTGEYTAGAKYICTLPNVKTVAWIAQENAEQQQAVPPALTKIFKQCGKTITFEWFPQQAVDPSPYVVKIVRSHPDFVMMNDGGGILVSLLKDFQQQGYPTTQIYSSSAGLNYEQILKPAGTAADGVYFTDETDNWDDPSPDVAAYLKAMRGRSNPKNFAPMQIYADIMWIYTAAKKIGFANFTPKTLLHYTQTANGVHIPLSRTLVNPGPKGFPAVKQPYSQVLQWRDGQLTLITKGTDNGWLSGYAGS
jgi:ABC-type branched-subunit amino acid transport system substrate-binding protein